MRWTALLLGMLWTARALAADAAVDFGGGTATCRVQAAADPTRTNLSAARLAAGRVARERARACLGTAVAALSLDGERSVARAAKGREGKLEAAVGAFEVAHETFAADGSVGLEATLQLSEVAAALGAGPKDAPVRLTVDVRGLQVPEALVVRVVDPEGRTVFAGPALRGRQAAAGPSVQATGVLAGGAASVIVPAAAAKRIREAHLAEGGLLLRTDE